MEHHSLQAHLGMCVHVEVRSESVFKEFLTEQQTWGYMMLHLCVRTPSAHLQTVLLSKNIASTRLEYRTFYVAPLARC